MAAPAEEMHGHRWAKVPSPNAGDSETGNVLGGVAVAPARSAWTVGSYTNHSETLQNVLILHWNGSTWKRVAGPQPGTRNALTAVAASSASNVWAVGFFDTGNLRQALAFHCC